MSKYVNNPVVEIDISADFSMVAIIKPNGDLYRKPFRINHDVEGFNYLYGQIKKVEEEFNMIVPIFMESTGMYHLNLFYFLKNKSLEVYILNPLITNSNRNMDIRKEKSDKKDSINIAKIGKFEDIKVSTTFDKVTFTIKGLCREYRDLIDSRSQYKNKLTADLRVFFPGYLQVFSNITGPTSTAVLSKYILPKAILDAPKEDIMKLLALSKRPADWCRKCYNKLIKAASEAIEIGIQSPLFVAKIKSSLAMIKEINNQIDAITTEIKNIVKSNDTPEALKKNISLIKSINGTGFITAVTLASEIGDINNFIKPKHLVAYLGIDPSTMQSGKFVGSKNKISKRGTPYGRRALYIIALASVRRNPNGKAVNDVLRNYYQEKLKSKKKKVALGAVMHKLVNYIFAVLRDQKEYQQRDPKLHERIYLNNQYKSVA